MSASERRFAISRHSTTRLPFYILILALLAGCGSVYHARSGAGTPGAPSGQAEDPLVGAWELVRATYGLPDEPVTIEQDEAPVQLKIFGGGRYAHVMNGPDGAFWGASAGTYTVSGNRYTEVTRWSSVPGNIGSVTVFSYRFEDGRLIMEGPVQIVDASGQPVDGFQKMLEVRRRAE